MSKVLIVGATRGLGLSLAKQYASQSSNTVYGTTRSEAGPESVSENIHWVPHIDLTNSGVGARLANRLGTLGVGGSMSGGVQAFDVVVSTPFVTIDLHLLILDRSLLQDTLPLKTLLLVQNGTRKSKCTVCLPWINVNLCVVIAANLFSATSSISVPFIISSLTKAKMLKKGSKVILVSSESGSITLRHESEGGGNYAHHASKAALNMVGKLLSLDLKDRGVIISIVHPGFMRTEMTKGVGFDKFWDDGGGTYSSEILKFEAEYVIQLLHQTRLRKA